MRSLILTRPICFIDIESAGPGDPNPSLDRIITLSIIKIWHHTESGTGEMRQYDYKVNPGIPITAERTAVHGIKDEDVAGLVGFDGIADAVYEIMAGCDIGAYNGARYDVPLLFEESIRAGSEFGFLLEAQIIDPGMIFKKKEERSLAAAVKFYTGLTHTGAHGATADNVATLEVLAAQLDRYPDLPVTIPELSEYCQQDSGPLTWDNKIRKGPDGEPVFNFGDKKGTKVREDIGLALWMLRKDFPTQTKRVLDVLVNKYQAEAEKERRLARVVRHPRSDDLGGEFAFTPQ